MLRTKPEVGSGYRLPSSRRAVFHVTMSGLRDGTARRQTQDLVERKLRVGSSPTARTT